MELHFFPWPQSKNWLYKDEHSSTTLFQALPVVNFLKTMVQLNNFQIYFAREKNPGLNSNTAALNGLRRYGITLF